MPFVPVLDCAEVAIHYELASKAIANILHFKYTTEPSEANLLTLATLVDTWVGAHWLPALSGACEYVGTEAKSLLSATAPYATMAAEAGTGGKVAEAPLANQNTFAIKFTTGVTGRSNRGRLYVPGLTEGDKDGTNHIELARVTVWVDALGLLQGDALAEGFTLSVLSRVTDAVVNNPGILVPITGIGFTDLRIDTLRRRLPTT
jgi:hypothetical protein